MKPPPRSAFRASLLLLLMTMVSLAAIGCENGAASTSVSTDLTSTTETTTSEATTSTEDQTVLSTTTSVSTGVSTGVSAARTSSEQVLANGSIKACGIIKEIWEENGTRKLTIDYVDYLTGAEADAAAIAAGEIAAGQHVEDDYYVRNNNPKLRTFTVSDSVAVTLDPRRSHDEGLVPITWAELSALWELSGPWSDRTGRQYGGKDRPTVPAVESRTRTGLSEGEQDEKNGDVSGTSDRIGCSGRCTGSRCDRLWQREHRCVRDHGPRGFR